MRLMHIVRDVKASAVRTAVPLMPSDTFGMTDDDDVIQEFTDQLLKLRRVDVIQAVVLRAAVKAVVSGVVHHLLTDANGALLQCIGM